MTDHELTLIPRRTFLQGAALLTAAAALGVSTKSEASRDTSMLPQTTLMFWNEERFVAPSHLGKSSAFAGPEAQITIHSHAVPGSPDSRMLHGITIHHEVNIDGEMRDVPFHAWTATWQTPIASRVRVPITPRQGLLFSATLCKDPNQDDCHFLDAGQTSDGVLLREGTYVLAVGNPRWRGCRLREQNGTMTIVRDTVSGPCPAGFEYVLLTVTAL